MPYNRHLEFIKNKRDVNPATGEVKPNTVTDFYVYDDHVTMWGWGYVNDFHPTAKYPTVDAVVNRMIEFMLEDGHRMTDGKRFRDQDGKLTMSIKEVAEATREEADAYYISGQRYLYKGKRYTLTRFMDKDAHGEDVEVSKLSSNDGHSIFLGDLGTFLPDVASSGDEIVRVEPPTRETAMEVDGAQNVDDDEWEAV